MTSKNTPRNNIRTDIPSASPGHDRPWERGRPSSPNHIDNKKKTWRKHYHMAAWFAELRLQFQAL